MNETVQHFADNYLRTYNETSRGGPVRWGVATQERMKYAIAAIAKGFGSKSLRDLTPQEVRRWARTQPHKTCTIARTMFRDALLDDLIDRNPFDGLRLEAPKGRVHLEVLNESEVSGACRAAQHLLGDKYGALYAHNFAGMIALSAYTGIRLGELAAIEGEDLRLDDGELNVRQAFNGHELKLPKNGRERRIVLPEQVNRWLPAEDVIAVAPDAWVFRSPNGQRLDRRRVSELWDPIRRAIDHPDLTWHGLRHCAATIMLERGLSTDLIAYQLGHADGSEITRLYLHPDEDRMRQEIKAAFA